MSILTDNIIYAAGLISAIGTLYYTAIQVYKYLLELYHIIYVTIALLCLFIVWIIIERVILCVNYIRNYCQPKKVISRRQTIEKPIPKRRISPRYSVRNIIKKNNV